MRIPHSNLICVLLVLFGISCQPEQYTVTPAFYHWQTHLQLAPLERDAIRSLAVKRVYAKFFDVIWDGKQAVPTAQIKIDVNSIPDSIQIVPTIYITNKTMQQLADTTIDLLARRIIEKVTTLAAPLPPYHQWDELQIDCDWTLQTRDTYFRLLQRLQTLRPSVVLSATIRLHQIKYWQKTGIPPVKKGVLMLYNTGKLEDWESENTILEIAVAKKYLSQLTDYKLPLDVALPIFEWGVVYREHRLFKLLHALDAAALRDTSRFTAVGDQRFSVNKSTYLRGHYLYRGDQIRLESVSAETLRESVQLVAPLIHHGDMQLLFYHLDTSTLRRYPATALQQLIDSMHYQ